MNFRAKTSLALALILIPPLCAIFSSYQYAFVLALFLSVVSLWFTEALPLAVTGLLVPVLISLYGLQSPKEAFSSFGTDILFLFIGCFLLARAMQKHGLDRRMAFWILSRPGVSGSPLRLIFVVTGMAWVMSMWVSNTATCAMLTPICLGIIEVFKDRFESERDSRFFAARLLLSCAFGSTMGGLATPIGTPPNLLALEFLREAGHSVSFLYWMMVGLPISFFMLAGLHGLFVFLFPLKVEDGGGLTEHFQSEFKSLGEIKREEIQIAWVFGAAIFFWITPGLIHGFFDSLPFVRDLFKPFTLSIVGISAGLSFFFLPSEEEGTTLVWEDARHIDWGTVLLFGGGISLGSLLQDSGFAAEVGAGLFSPEQSLFVLMGIAVGISLLMSEFASNTASASVVFPVLLGSVSQMGLSEESLPLLLMASSFGASFGFMLPVSTPPNAIVYGTGKLKLNDMISSGIFFDILGLILITTWTYLLISWV